MLSKTPFYAEMGGQVGDKGVLVSPSGEIVNIFDTKKENNVGVHLSYEIPSDPTEVMTARIDKVARAATSANHSATHLLHEALREVLGTHVEQKDHLYLRKCYVLISLISKSNTGRIETGRASCQFKNTHGYES